jgi:hypothetical protein
MNGNLKICDLLATRSSGCDIGLFVHNQTFSSAQLLSLPDRKAISIVKGAAVELISTTEGVLYKLICCKWHIYSIHVPRTAS